MRYLYVSVKGNYSVVLSIIIYFRLWSYGTPLQYSSLENPMGRGACWATVHGVVEGWTQLSDFTFTFHFHALEKEMATHSSILAWRIPWMGEPGGLPSTGSHRVRHHWSNLAAAAVGMSQVTPFFKKLLIIKERERDGSILSTFPQQLPFHL